MSQSRLEWRVGLFALVGLVLIAGLLVRFSKGESLFSRGYEILLKARSVGGIKKGAAVLMAGVQVGSVRDAALTPDGRAVLIKLRIFRGRAVHGDARFAIEQAGVLGDQYVSITPTTNKASLLKNGDLVICEEAFNLQEAARAAAGFLERVDTTAQRLNDAIVRLDQTLLAEQSLTNLTSTISNFKLLSEKALGTVDDLGSLIGTNAEAISSSMSNLISFSRQMNEAATGLRETVESNRAEVTAAIKNIDSAALLVNDLLTNLHAGRGLAGGLLRDERMRSQMSETISNLAVVSSNLARFGLLHKPRPAKTSAAPPKRP